jgi:hypothetical protein
VSHDDVQHLVYALLGTRHCRELRASRRYCFDFDATKEAKLELVSRAQADKRFARCLSGSLLKD